MIRDDDAGGGVGGDNDCVNKARVRQEHVIFTMCARSSFCSSSWGSLIACTSRVAGL